MSETGSEAGSRTKKLAGVSCGQIRIIVKDSLAEKGRLLSLPTSILTLWLHDKSACAYYPVYTKQSFPKVNARNAAFSEPFMRPYMHKSQVQCHLYCSGQRKTDIYGPKDMDQAT